MDSYLKKLYLDENSSTFLSGINAMYREAKKKYPKIKVSDINDFLYSQRTYTLHKPYRKYKPSKIIAAGLDCDHQIDLCDMRGLKKDNKYFGWILTCVDVLSKYVWAFPVKSKHADECAKAYKKIITQGRKPWRLFHDDGKEFKGEFAKLCHMHGIKQIVMKNPITKAANVERFNRTLKTRLYKFFTEKNTKNWVKILPKLVRAINISVNRMTGMRPVDVTHENDQMVHEKLFGEAKLQRALNRKRTDLLKIGDLVRIFRQKKTWEKGYTHNFSKDIYVVTDQIVRDRIIYKLRCLEDNEDIDGIFYREELSKVLKNESLV